MQFYDVKTRQFVEVSDSDLKKTKYTRTTKSGSTQTRYAARGNYQGRNLTKFVSEATWQGMDAPME